MLNPYRMKALEGLLDYISGLQGGDLKELMMNQEKSETPEDEAKEGPLVQALEDKMGTEMHDQGKPKGIAIEKVSIMGKPKPGMEAGKPMPDEEEVGEPKEDGMNATDDELEELYNKFRR